MTNEKTDPATCLPSPANQKTIFDFNEGILKGQKVLDEKFKKSLVDEFQRNHVMHEKDEPEKYKGKTNQEIIDMINGSDNGSTSNHFGSTKICPVCRVEPVYDKKLGGVFCPECYLGSRVEIGEDGLTAISKWNREVDKFLEFHKVFFVRHDIDYMGRHSCPVCGSRSLHTDLGCGCGSCDSQTGCNICKCEVGVVSGNYSDVKNKSIAAWNDWCRFLENTPSALDTAKELVKIHEKNNKVGYIRLDKVIPYLHNIPSIKSEEYPYMTKFSAFFRKTEEGELIYVK